MITDEMSLSSQEMGSRFDLLATDAKEYALFLIDLEGHLICWNAGASASSAINPTRSLDSIFPASSRRKTLSRASRSMN